MSVGGIPTRTNVCATLSPRGRGLDDAKTIQKAIDDCPVGGIVQLNRGTFIVSDGAFLLINKGITLRGAGPDQTALLKSDGAKVYPREPTNGERAPIIIVGTGRYSSIPDKHGIVSSANLAFEAAKGTNSVILDDAREFAPGQIVLLDEASGAGWQPDPMGRGKVWASADYRVVWKKHDPPLSEGDDFEDDDFPTTPESAGGWFSRLDRPIAEIKEIASVSGNTVTFTTPLHISYRPSHRAQLSRYALPHVRLAGVENLKLIGGDEGNLRFQWAAFSWARNIESTAWQGAGVAIDRSFRVELREFYIHDAAWVQPGGDSYAIALTTATSEALIENGISIRANKVIVAQSAGAGSVVGYNYMDMSYINYHGHWLETGINASHMLGSHHVLFEGNYSHNADSDNTHGNSIYIAFFRNHLRGIRAPFNNQAGGRVDDSRQAGNRPKRAVGMMGTSYWMSFVGNVLGAEGKMSGWLYETTHASGTPGIWMLGWDTAAPVDRQVAATALRHANFDYVTNSVVWGASNLPRSLPNSLYLSTTPAFFQGGRGYKWPWVDPVGPTKVHALPAKVRYDAGTPFAQP